MPKTKEEAIAELTKKLSKNPSSDEGFKKWSKERMEPESKIQSYDEETNEFFKKEKQNLEKIIAEKNKIIEILSLEKLKFDSILLEKEQEIKTLNDLIAQKDEIINASIKKTEEQEFIWRNEEEQIAKEKAKEVFEDWLGNETSEKIAVVVPVGKNVSEKRALFESMFSK